MNLQTCRLCGANGQLRNSHILPEFLYKENLYSEETKRLHIISLGRREGPKVDFEQKGIRERLFCQACETKLSRYEHHAAEAFFRNPDRTLIMHNLVEYQGLDFNKMRLFQHSIVWRCAIANHPLFSKIKLSNTHLRNLRRMIREEDPGEPEAYPLLVKEDTSGFLDTFLGMPLLMQIRLKGKRFSRFVFPFANQIWFIDIDTDGTAVKGTSLEKAILREDGILMATRENFKETPFYHGLRKDFGALPQELVDKIR